jgi:hypothetical protein
MKITDSKLKFTLQILFFLFLLSCSTRSNKDYVKLSIPEEFKNNPEVVEKLQKDVDQLNKVFNSIDDFIEDIVSLKEEVMAYDSTKSYTLFKAKITLKMVKIQSSEAKILYNALWYIGKDIVNKDTTLITKLSTNDRIAYRKCLNHIKIQTDLLNSRLTEMNLELEELNKLIEEKMPELAKKGQDGIKNNNRIDSVKTGK